MCFGGGASEDECLGHGSQCWLIATFRGHGYSIRIRINASRHDSRAGSVCGSAARTDRMMSVRLGVGSDLFCIGLLGKAGPRRSWEKQV